MKLTDLANLDQSPSPILYGVEVDGECFTPPPGLKLIGLKWQGSGPEQISDELIDTIIAFGLSGVEVVVEVDPAEDVNHTYLLTLAGNAGFSVAAIPPDRDTDVDRWADQCAAFAIAFLTTPNFSKTLFPVSGYLSYLIAEFFAGADALMPTDPYTIERFVDASQVSWSDACKDRMRAAMEDALGGNTELTNFLAALVMGLHNEAEKYVLEASGANQTD